MKINHYSAMQGVFQKHETRMKSLMQSVSSGKQPLTSAGIAIGANLKALSGALKMGTRNVADAHSMVSTADSAAASAAQVVGRMRDLTIQAANGTYSDADRANMQAEIDQLKEEYTHIVEGTSFNGNQLLTSAASVHVETGSGSGVQLTGADLRTAAGGGTNPAIDLNVNVTGGGSLTGETAKLDAAMEQITQARAQYGAEQNRLSSAEESNHAQEMAASSSLSRMEDTDYAKAMTELAKERILAQATASMLKLENDSARTLLGML